MERFKNKTEGGDFLYKVKKIRTLCALMYTYGKHMAYLPMNSNSNSKSTCFPFTFMTSYEFTYMTSHDFISRRRRKSKRGNTGVPIMCIMWATVFSLLLYAGMLRIPYTRYLVRGPAINKTISIRVGTQEHRREVQISNAVCTSVPLRQRPQNVGGVDDHRTSRGAR